MGVDPTEHCLAPGCNFVANHYRGYCWSHFGERLRTGEFTKVDAIPAPVDLDRDGPPHRGDDGFVSPYLPSRLKSANAVPKIGDWFKMTWAPHEIRVAVWLARGVPARFGYAIGWHVIREACPDEAKAYASLERTQLLFHALCHEVVDMPWHLRVRPCMTTKGPGMPDDFLSWLWIRGIRSWTAKEARRFWREHPRPEDRAHWWRIWAAGFDSFAVLPEYPLDAQPWFRGLVMDESSFTLQDNVVNMTPRRPDGSVPGFRAPYLKRRELRKRNRAWKRHAGFGTSEHGQWLEAWGVPRALAESRGFPHGYGSAVGGPVTAGDVDEAHRSDGAW